MVQQSKLVRVSAACIGNALYGYARHLLLLCCPMIVLEAQAFQPGEEAQPNNA
jgi:hypothetical protein